MQQVDPAYLFEMGDAVRGLRRHVNSDDLFETWFILNTARASISGCVFESIYAQHFRNPLIASASTLIGLIDRAMVKLFPNEGTGEPLPQWELSQIQNVFTKFEYILVSELQSIASYIVTRKGGFDTTCLVDTGHLFFSPELSQKVPEAISDLDQAMRCIAFELPTAAGFHLHRANEAVLRIYWDNVTNGLRRPKQGNMGVYLRELGKLDKGNASVRSHLLSIKDFHRNPLMHPEQSLETVDEAIDLMSAVRCAIGYMLKEIGIKRSPLIEALLGEQDDDRPVQTLDAD